MSIIVDSGNNDSRDIEKTLVDESNKNYQLLGRGYTLGTAAIGEVIELVGAAITNAGIFTDNDDMTLGGLITTGVGISTIFVIENMVMLRGKNAGISLDRELIKKIAVRALGGIALIAGYFTIIAGFAKDSSDIMVGGVVTMDVGIGFGLFGLYLLSDYL
jgi:hypothetical protein